MSDRRYRHLLRRQGLPVALACALAASLGGCASFRMSDLVGFRSSQAACQSASWPTQVLGSVQRAETQSDMPEPVAKESPARVVEYSYEPVAQDHSERVAEKGSEPAAEDSSVSVAEDSSERVAEDGSERTADSSSEPAAEAGPSTEPPSAAPPPPAAQSPAAEPQQDVIARLPEPVAPPRPPPPPEVVEVCGATDTTCQDQLTTLLADPMHKWIRAEPTLRDDRTGVRILAYRVLTPVLACEDLRQGVRETEPMAAGKDSGATQPEAAEAGTEEATEGGKSLAWVQLLRRAVELELRAEIEKRC